MCSVGSQVQAGREGLGVIRLLDPVAMYRALGHLNSLKGVGLGDYIGKYYRGYEGGY